MSNQLRSDQIIGLILIKKIFNTEPKVVGNYVRVVTGDGNSTIFDTIIMKYFSPQVWLMFYPTSTGVVFHINNLQQILSNKATKKELININPLRKLAFNVEHYISNIITINVNDNFLCVNINRDGRCLIPKNMCVAAHCQVRISFYYAEMVNAWCENIFPKTMDDVTAVKIIKLGYYLAHKFKCVKSHTFNDQDYTLDIELHSIPYTPANILGIKFNRVSKTCVISAITAVRTYEKLWRKKSLL
jgi:hypothetical protein